MDRLNKGKINCRTIEEQEMVLDIFEMLGYRWAGGEKPREWDSYAVPMYYCIYDVELGKIRQHDVSSYLSAIEARDLKNFYISLKRRKSNEA